MLQTLRVKNLAIVENIRVEFTSGLNVITGETGAGKSILAAALNLVLGSRADKTMIRAGEKECGVEAMFQLPDAAAIDSLLEEIGLEPCEDGLLIIRRIISPASSKNLVNDSPATLQGLKRIGTLLVDLHGPHDHQSLLDQQTQLRILDAFGHLTRTATPYQAAYATLRDLERQRDELQGDDQDLKQLMELLQHQVGEIEQAELGDLSEEDLRREHTLAANAQEVVMLASSIQSALMDDEAAAFDQVALARTQLGSLAGILDEAGEWRDEAESILVQIQELSKSINSRLQDTEMDPERFQWLEDRLSQLHKLKRKYGATVADIQTFGAKARERLEGLETRGERLAKIETDLAAAAKHVQTTGQALRKARLKAAQKLADAVTNHLHDLGFPHGEFAVELTPTEPGPSGLDDIDFGFAPNVGEPMRPLRLIASSGEISRVMLATKTVLADHDQIPVLVFDEVDSNVGGEMGNAIGDKLAEIAANHQVLCITHLPQVAVHGNHHLVVTKGVDSGRTRTRIEVVDNTSRAEEIARMLGGKDLTSVTLRHAQEMLKKK